MGVSIISTASIELCTITCLGMVMGSESQVPEHSFGRLFFVTVVKCCLSVNDIFQTLYQLLALDFQFVSDTLHSADVGLQIL